MSFYRRGKTKGHVKGTRARIVEGFVVVIEKRTKTQRERAKGNGWDSVLASYVSRC